MALTIQDYSFDTMSFFRHEVGFHENTHKVELSDGG